MEAILIVFMLQVGVLTNIKITPMPNIAICEQVGKAILTHITNKEALGKAFTSRIPEGYIQYKCVN